MFSEADMVRWLTFPTELNTVPDEMELKGVLECREVRQRYFLWKFRTFAPDNHAKDGWMAGLSGPFEIDEPPAVDPVGSTFSAFNQWDAMSPLDHALAVAKIVGADLTNCEMIDPEGTA
jgi:hypothetical protein